MIIAQVVHDYMKICLFCDNFYYPKTGYGKFCSSTCSAKYSSSFQIKKNCFKCGREITISNFERHSKTCNGIARKQNLKDNPIVFQEIWKQLNGKYKCPDCTKEFTRAGICSHIWRVHTEEGKKFKVTPTKPNSFNRKCQGWSKGLTKETDSRLRKCSEHLKEGYKTGRNTSYFKGCKHSSETIQKMSLTRIKLLDSTTGWWGVHHNYASVKAGAVHLHSNWEFETAKVLDASRFQWVRPENWFSYVDQEGIKRRYQPDFYLPEFDLYIEVKPYMPAKQKWKIDHVSKNINLLVIRSKKEIENIEEVVDAQVAKWHTHNTQNVAVFDHVGSNPTLGTNTWF